MIGNQTERAVTAEQRERLRLALQRVRAAAARGGVEAPGYELEAAGLASLIDDLDEEIAEFDAAKRSA